MAPFDPKSFLAEPDAPEIPEAAAPSGNFDHQKFLEKPAQAPAPAPEPKPSTFNPSEFLGAPKEEMPGPVDALLHGVGSGIRGVKQTLTVNSTAPQEEHKPLPEEAPFEWGDITSPISQGLPKVAYRLGEGAPTLAAGIAGGIAGGAVGAAPGAIAGGAGGAALGSVLQSVGPIFQEELKKNPQNPDAAWDSTVKQAAAGGLFSAAGWAAFPLRVASGPLKQMAFQAFGVQPAVSMAHKATTNAITGQPLTEGLGDAYASGAVMTALPAAGHAAINAAVKTVTPASRLTGQRGAVQDRLTDNQETVKFKTFDDAYTALKDDLHPFNVIEKGLIKLGQHGLIPAEASPYVLARLSRGASGKASSWIDWNTSDYNSNSATGEGLRQILRPVKNNIDEFEVYLASKRTVELHSRGIDTGIPLADAQWVVQNDHARFEPTARRVNDYQGQLLRYIKDSGFLNDEQYNNIKSMNADYVPFYRLMDETKSGPPNAGGGLNTKQPIKAIEGSQRKIINPIESIIKNTHLFVEMAERNRAKRALVELAERTPGADTNLGIERVSHNAPIELSPSEKSRFMQQLGLPANAPIPPQAFTIFRPKSLDLSHTQLDVFRDGKREVWKVPQELAKAASGMDAQSIGAIQKIIATPSKLLRAGVTLAPDFFIRNMARDQLTAFAFSKNGYVPVYDFLKGSREIMGAHFNEWLDSRAGRNAILDAIGTTLGKGEGFKEWLRSGGANAALVSGERNYIAGQMRRLAHSGSYKDMAGVITRPVEGLQVMSEFMESSTRIGDFIKARNQGKSMAQSGFESREVTLDFWRIGAKTRALNNVIAFMNANMEGLDRAARAFKERPYVTTFKVSAGIFLPSMLLAWANSGDRRVDEIPAWERDFFWIFPTNKWMPASKGETDDAPKNLKPGENNGIWKLGTDGQWYRNAGNIYKVPKPFELGLMFGSVPERLMDTFYRDKPDAWYNVGKSIQRAFMLDAGNFIPNAVIPIAEQATNHSFFTDRQLVPQPMKTGNKNDINPAYQFTPYTTEVAKMAGKGLDKVVGGTYFRDLASPIVLENYVRAWTGSLGTQSLRMADEVLKKTGVINAPPEAAPTTADKWFQRAFVARYPSAGAESIQKFYDNYGERKENTNTVNFLGKRVGRPEDIPAFQADHPTSNADQAYKNLNTLQKYVRTVMMDKTMQPDEKRRVLDNTYFQMIEIAKKGNQLFRDTQKPGQSKASPLSPEESP